MDGAAPKGQPSLGEPGIVRADICVDVERPDELQAVESWFAQWRERLAYISDDTGCGCCVHIWTVDGPEEAIRAIPAASRAFRP